MNRETPALFVARFQKTADNLPPNGKVSKKKHASNKTSSGIGAMALTLRGLPAEEADARLRQAEGLQRLAAKVPRWAAVENLTYPPRLSLEQCSSERTASYKADIVRRLVGEHSQRMADLTGGFGVDFSFIAPLFARPVYVERQEELCRIARHNFPLLDLAHAEIVNGNGTAFLQDMAEADFLFIDPARRDQRGRKTVLIEDCEPNLVDFLPLLLEKAPYTMVKLSPMLDIHRAIASLSEVRPQCVAEVHVVADGGECKELLLVLSRETVATPALCVSESGQNFKLDFEEEQTAVPAYTSMLATYLYEPGAALMKAGVFKWVAAHFGLQKLHPNSHLYTGNDLIKNFPGRSFRVKNLFSFSKADLKALKTEVSQANLTVRNFPGSVAELRKRLKLKEGGMQHIFATTLADESHRLVLTERIL